MQGTREIKRRIRSVQNTQQITKAMKMVAAAKLRRAQERAEASRPYTDKIREVIGAIASATEDVSHPLLETREIKKTGYIVMTSDRGLAGGYNANILRLLTSTVKERHQSNDEYSIFVIGRKGRDFLKKRNYPLIGEIVGLSDSPQFADIKQIAKTAVAMYAEKVFDELYLVYNRFNSAISQTPVVEKLLPLADLADSGAGNYSPYEFEPSAIEVLNDLLPRFAETVIYNALLNAKASEHGARMTAMGNATDNATEMIATLTLNYNRARQASITQEISEIVGGANALS
ncbi:ATP synthase F1 subunit gamma [Tepidibacillus fermentans]|uniref:ATP synthase gamma chain n=1 Tax=Tepidibacillus fermentans TaxID=1281767 RepID=A0A4V2UT00_9BACI|nr:ATP synthase F1 subunit gamma [Tepidibacillus fermentans]TCS83404.1 F-type H+-transporting ATPase subunit gamma [Tepidibacillus fermentans]